VEQKMLIDRGGTILSSIPFSFSIQSKLCSLSEKIKCYSQKKSTNDQISEIFFEKEKYCLPLLLAHIIKNLTFPDRSKIAFLSVVQNYNMRNKKDLKFEDFDKIHWIRTIQNEVVLPEVVRHTIWAINNDNEKSKINTLPENKRDMALCLSAYHKTHDEPSITEEGLKQIINSLNLTWESISFLLEKHILEYDKNNKKYFWYGHIHYQERFENEVSVLLWILMKKQFHDPKKSFERFIYLANKTGLYLRNLYSLLSKVDIQQLYEQAVNYIQEDHDLLVCDDELEKMRLDSHHSFNIGIDERAPDFNLRCNTISELLEKINLLESRRIYDFTYQKTRNYVYIVLQLIFQFEQMQQVNKINIKRFLTDIERPFLFFELKHLLINDYPHMIPFLITDIELIPLAFQILDEIKLNEKLFSSDEGAHNKYEKEHNFHNEVWLEFFEITLNHFIESYHFNKDAYKNQQLISKAISSIFINVANKLFDQYWSNVPSRNIILNTMQERYISAYNKFKRSKTNFNIYNKGLYIKSKISYFLLPSIIEILILRLSDRQKKYNHFFDFDIVNLDVLIDMLELAIIPFDTIEIEEKQRHTINNFIPKSTKCIYEYLTYFFMAQKMDIIEYDFSIKTKEVEIAFDFDKLNRTNWALLMILMNNNGLYQHLMDTFDSSIKFDKYNNRYSNINKNQYHRIRIMLRILLYSYLNLKKREINFNFSIEQQERTIANIEKSIIKYAKLYSKDDIQNNRIDVFYDISVLNENKYTDKILHLLLQALNNFPIMLQKEFVEDFLAETADLKRMLTSINNIESEEVNKIVVDYIVKINIDDYIESCFTVTEWEETLIEAINSEKHWYFAESLIKEIKAHYEKRKGNSDQVIFFLYQVELSLAIHNKDFEKLKNTQFHSKGFGVHQEYNSDDIRTYFLALYSVENDTDYDNAIKLLNYLLSKDEKNLRYALLLYRARFLKYLNSNEADITNYDEINIAWNEWQIFIEKLGKDKDKMNELFKENILLYSLPYFITHKDDFNFDYTIASISDSNELLGNPKLVKLIYYYYIERGLENYAFRYLNRANNFFKRNGKTIPAIINELFINSDNEVLIKLRGSFRDIISLHYRQIPFVTPLNINGKNELRAFILYELIKSLKKLQEREKAIGIEDNYTDLIQSILSMRFPFYGWNISEQSHRGVSPGGKRPGEIDLAVKAADEDIALVEALVLKNRNFKKTNDHILKCFSYSNQSDQFYIIIYYQGKNDKFNYNWEGYKENIKKIIFPKARTLKKPKSPFIDLNGEFDNIQSFKVAKTCHKGNFEMYHIMVDFSHSGNLSDKTT
jgi:hypothetical protein